MLMTLILVLITALIATTVTLIRMMAHGERSLPVTSEWINDLSIECYRPMMRLLDAADIEFLRSQPGYTRDLEATLRAQRSQVFRGYLRRLNSDFQRVCTALKVVMAQSENDRADLATVLVHQQVMFAMCMAAIQTRLLLYRWGVCHVDVTSVVHIFDGMRAELCNLMPVATPA